jgi:hypothetical protein
VRAAIMQQCARQCVAVCGSVIMCGSASGGACVLGIPYGLLYVKYGLIPREF